MTKTASYILSAYSFVTSLSQDKLLDTGYPSKDGNPIPSFDENLLINLCSEVQKIFNDESNILELEGNFIIVGDIHGSFHDLLRILRFIHESSSKVLFLGDYVDRGNFSLECITILFAMKIMRPDSFYLIRGNHEFDAICSLYGFKNEIIHYHDPKKEKNSSPQTNNNTNNEQHNQSMEYIGYNTNCYRYTENLYDSFIQAFSYLPIAAILNKKTFCIHGGLSPKIDHVECINTLIKRPIHTFEESLLLTDLVWSDPSHSSKLFEENLRGRGYLFNRESIKNFLENSLLSRMVRGHQCVKKGSLKNFGDKCITVFSASSYDQNIGNSSAILQLFESDDSIKVVTFPPLSRLEKSDALYYKVERLNTNQRQLKSCFSLQFNTMSLKIPSANSFSQGKTQRSDGLLPRQSSLLKFGSITKPKFTTNCKKKIITPFPNKPIFHTSSLNSFPTIFEDDEGTEANNVICKNDSE